MSKKIVIVNTGASISLSRAMALALVDLACVKAVSDPEVKALHCRPQLPDLDSHLVMNEVDTREVDWYQRFAGKRGKPPRY
jgi:hypothetical protein